MVWIRAATLGSYAEVARSVGLDAGRMLWRAGIKPALLDDPENRIPIRAAVHLLEDSAEQADCPHFGLLLAERRDLSTLGAVGLLLPHAPTLADAIADMVRYQGLLTEALALSTETLGDALIVRVALTHEFDETARQAVEVAVAGVALALVQVGGKAWRPESVHFRHRAPDDPRFHQRLFNAPVEFDSSFTGLVFNGTALAAANPAANPGLARYARDYLELLRRPDGEIVIEERVRRSLLVLLPMGRATLDAVGADIGLHPRALQRQLERAELSFARVLNEARRELAVRHLRSRDLPLAEIAGLIGFGSASSFTRWFRGEFGVAPQAWRAGMRAKD